MRAGIVVEVTPEDRVRLERIVGDRNTPQKHSARARVILATAEDCGTLEIVRRSGLSKPVVWRWQERFMHEGVDGLLRDKTRPPGKRPLPGETVRRVVNLTLAAPPGETTHWTGRALAAAAGVSLRSVQRIWAAHGLTPHRVQTFRLSTDPRFLEKFTDVVGLYVDPPAHAVVLSVDEKRSHGVIVTRSLRVRLQPSLWRPPMSARNHLPAAQATIRTDLGAIFVSLELSRTSWLLTSLSPGDGERMSKHALRSGDVAGLRARFSQLKEKVQIRTGQAFPVIVIQEAGLDGFWIHRLLQGEGIESHVVDPASIATSRRRRRAKTDKIDGQALVRALLAYKRGEPRVCAMVRAPTPQEEDRRRICRERKTLTAERVKHVNRIKGLLFAQGITDYEPLPRNRRERLEELRTGDGRPLPPHLKAQIGRELDRLELALQQIKSVETERDAVLSPSDEGTPAPGAMLKRLKGIGPEFAGVLWSEGLFRSFSNRRQVAAYAGLAPTPWQSGSVTHEQGVSKAGNPRLRTTMIQLAWLWVRHQPHSILTQWFHQRAQLNGGRIRKVLIVALARKLLIAFWKYVTAGIVPEGAETTAA
jgi:transposase